MGDLHDTNVALFIMAAVSVLEALLLIGIGIGGWLVYRRAMQLVNDLEARQIAPVREKVDAILGDVKSLTARVNSLSPSTRIGSTSATPSPPLPSRRHLRREFRLLRFPAVVNRPT